MSVVLDIFLKGLLFFGIFSGIIVVTLVGIQILKRGIEFLGKHLPFWVFPIFLLFLFSMCMSAQQVLGS